MSPLFNVISLSVGILGVCWGVFAYLSPLKKKKPVYSCRTTRLIRDKINTINSLEVYYDKRKLSALTITKIALWNDGRETVSASDISPIDQLRIEAGSGNEILSCELLSQTKEANGFCYIVSEDKKSIYLSFDYLDYKEGAVLKIRHTGDSNSSLVLRGSIKAVKEIKRKGIVSVDNKEEQKNKVGRVAMWVSTCFIGLFALSFLFLGILVLFLPNPDLSRHFLERLISLPLPLFERLGISLMSITMGLVIVSYIVSSFRTLVPKELYAEYNDNDF